ncbi:MAG: RecX family transcriptional regulator [candidate division WOR-3 bacterium]|nr:MAG: RecX family transcriptional regulator [candidate division WOR-3 bacterium]
MKISKIEPQKRNKKRSSIYIDGEFAFGLSNELVLKYNLNADDEISDTLIKDVLLEEEKQKIKQRAFRLLQYRDRSIQELANRLLRIGFDNRLVQSVIEDFKAEGTLDDEKFANAFVSDYTTLNPRGNRFIIQELQKRGVAKEIISKVVHERDENFLIKDYIERKLSHLNRNEPREKQKIVRRLLMRGFSSGAIYEVLNEER